ncbi:synapsin, ATP binding domain-containing protein [Phthorimaea operculella]|nr:synapsin, ATP binding domain-containing protein [Phthorimaea operculella]
MLSLVLRVTICDYYPWLLRLKFGGVPSINSLNSIYHFQAWCWRVTTCDHRALLLGLKFGGVPSINSLNSIYHFQDRPWVFGHLLQLQRRLGRENFPLVEQTYYHNYTDMVSHRT